jgi:hypothetical protein
MDSNFPTKVWDGQIGNDKGPVGKKGGGLRFPIHFIHTGQDANRPTSVHPGETYRHGTWGMRTGYLVVKELKMLIAGPVICQRILSKIEAGVKLVLCKRLTVNRLQRTAARG